MVPNAAEQACSLFLAQYGSATRETAANETASRLVASRAWQCPYFLGLQCDMKVVERVWRRWRGRQWKWRKSVLHVMSARAACDGKAKAYRSQTTVFVFRRSHNSVNSAATSSAAGIAPTSKRSAERRVESRSKNAEEAGGNVASYHFTRAYIVNVAGDPFSAAVSLRVHPRELSLNRQFHCRKWPRVD